METWHWLYFHQSVFSQKWAYLQCCWDWQVWTTTGTYLLLPIWDPTVCWFWLLIFLIVASTRFWFGFVLTIVLVIQGCCSCCWTVLTQSQGLFCSSSHPTSKQAWGAHTGSRCRLGQLTQLTKGNIPFPYWTVFISTYEFSHFYHSDCLPALLG